MGRNSQGRYVSEEESNERRQGGDCDFPVCPDDDTTPHEHVATGEVYRYCDAHAPDADGETWEVVDGDE